MYGGYWRFLTVWNFLLQIFVNILLAVGEHIESARTLGDLLHHGISFGCTVVVFVIYWGLYFTKTELIRPELVAQENFEIMILPRPGCRDMSILKNAKKWYPEWLSVVEHGIIMPVAVLNSALVSKKSNTISYFTVLGFVFDYQTIRNYCPLGP